MRHEAVIMPAGRDPLEMMDRNRTLLAQAQGYIYKQKNEADLEAYVFAPEDHEPGDMRPAILFFHSSAWDSGLVSQFAPHCLHFAQRGMVAITFEYRLASRHGGGPIEAMADGRSAVRWVRTHATELGIHADKIIGAGGSAGSHIMLTAALLRGHFDDEDDDTSWNCAPNALVLFDPVVDVHSRTAFGADKFPHRRIARIASPIRHVGPDLPPMILFQGAQDRLLPVETTRKFVRKMRRWPLKNVCEFVPFDGCGHSFFNFNVDPRFFEATLNLADQFLVSQGFLAPESHGESQNRL
ncbi:MAG: alpha/beta hydrolase [Verrucomicrobiales bacterium]